MITHLQETWKIQSKVMFSSTMIIFLIRLIKIFSWSFNIKFSKINKMNRKVEGCSTPEKHYEPIQHN